MHEYVNSKVTEYSLILNWIESEISILQAKSIHSYIINLLKDKLLDLKQLHSRLKAILGIQDNRVISRALPIIHEIEYQAHILTDYYIPGLKREEKSDLFLRALLLSNTERWGLSWIKDILVRLDGPHAIFSGLIEIPIIFAPPQQANSLLDMAGIYHEVGHNVFQRFEKIADNLTETIFGYFSGLMKEIGPMRPEKRAQREEAIEDAKEYWAIERLSEIFSDIYATYICGPVYYFSCVDMAVKMGGNPFYVSTKDVHPPAAARVNACYKVLLPNYQGEETIILVQKIWNTYTECYQRTPDFDLKCANALIDLIVKTSLQEIQNLLPNAQHYSSAVIDLSQAKMLTSSDSLEIILSKSLKILLKEAEYYPEWEKNAFKVLHNQT
jgi:hypothetical protein